MAATRYIAGLEWRPDAAKPPQETITLTREDAWALTCGNRMDRLQEGSPGVRLQLVERAEPQSPSLLITGKRRDAVEEMKEKVLRLLHQEPGQIIAVHELDIDALHRNKGELTRDIEEQSGCRIVVEAPIPKAGDPDLSRRPRNVHLLGDQAAQARAIELLSLHCPQMMQHACLASRPGDILRGFNLLVRGGNVDILENGTVARRRVDVVAGGSSPPDCIVSTDGCMELHPAGVWFAFAINAVSPTISEDSSFRGATRLGVTPVPLLSPPPITLLNEPRCSWVLGRGMARYPSNQSEPAPGADFDICDEGDYLGVLISKEGALKVFRKKTPKPFSAPSSRSPSPTPRRQTVGTQEWTPLVEWEAAIPEPSGTFYPLIELSGRIAEVQLLPQQPPPKLSAYKRQTSTLSGGSASRPGSRAQDPRPESRTQEIRPESRTQTSSR